MENKKCFVVMPYGLKPIPGIDASFDFEKIFRVIMEPAIRAAGYEPVRADKSALSGLIHVDMFKDLRDRPLVLADLSLHNPNVFYELGVRHVMAQRGTVLICERSTQLPFDVKLSRVIHYQCDGASVDWEEAERVKPMIAEALREAVNRPDSPVHAMLDRVLPPSTAQIEMESDTRVNYADDSVVLMKYATTVAQSWDKSATVSSLLQEHEGSRFGVLALAQYCLQQTPLPEDAERVASRLRLYAQYRLAKELFSKLDREKNLEPWRYMQYGSVVSELEVTIASAEAGLSIQRKGLRMAKKAYRAQQTNENRWNFAYCMHQVGGMHEWMWRKGDRKDDEHLTSAIAMYTESTRVVAADPPSWINFLLRNHLKLLYLLRARDGRNDRPDDEEHLAAILRLDSPTGAVASVQSSVGWFKVIAHVERGSGDTSMREAVKRLDRDAQLEAKDAGFNRRQLYFFTRRMMSDTSEYQRYPELWNPIAQLLKDAAGRALR